MTTNEWDDFLRRWKKACGQLSRPGPETRIEKEARANGSVTSKPATEKAIKAIEASLGAALPPSLRSLYLASNGLYCLAEEMEGRIVPCEKLAWFRDQSPRTVSTWSRNIGIEEPSDDRYFVYGAKQDPALLRPSYLSSCLFIGDDLETSSYLLNPKVVHEGEWEAWDFSPKIAGAVRYRSFQDMLHAWLKSAEQPSADPGLLR